MSNDPRRICARVGCGKVFKSDNPAREYCSKLCQNRAAQYRVRERARKYHDLVAKGKIRE